MPLVDGTAAAAHSDELFVELARIFGRLRQASRCGAGREQQVREAVVDAMEVMETQSGLEKDSQEKRFIWKVRRAVFLLVYHLLLSGELRRPFELASTIAKWYSELFEETIVAQTCLSSAEYAPKDLESAWKQVFRCVCCGLIEPAKLLLEYIVSLSAEHAEEIKVLMEILKFVPALREYHLHPADVRKELSSWKSHLGRFLSGSQSTNIQTVLKILLGDDETLLSSSNSWLEFLIGKLIFQVPFARKGDLPELTQESFDAFSQHSRLGTVLDVFKCILSFEFTLAVSSVKSIFLDPWFVLHFAEMLFVAGAFTPTSSQEYTSLIREKLMIEFAIQLLGDDGLGNSVRGLEILALYFPNEVESYPMWFKELVRACGDDEILCFTQKLGLSEEFKFHNGRLCESALEKNDSLMALKYSICSEDTVLLEESILSILMKVKNAPESEVEILNKTEQIIGDCSFAAECSLPILKFARSLNNYVSSKHSKSVDFLTIDSLVSELQSILNFPSLCQVSLIWSLTQYVIQEVFGLFVKDARERGYQGKLLEILQHPRLSRYSDIQDLRLPLVEKCLFSL